MTEAPHPSVVQPVAGQERVVFLKPLVRNPNIDVGEYTYHDDSGIRSLCPAGG
jgi:virginiamycin A acetyltransferase